MRPFKALTEQYLRWHKISTFDINIHRDSNKRHYGETSMPLTLSINKRFSQSNVYLNMFLSMQLDLGILLPNKKVKR